MFVLLPPLAHVCGLSAGIKYLKCDWGIHNSSEQKCTVVQKRKRKEKKTQQEGKASTDIQNKLITTHMRPPRRNVWYVCVRTQKRRENKHLDMIPSDSSSERLGKHQTPHQLSGERNECGATRRVERSQVFAGVWSRSSTEIPQQ